MVKTRRPITSHPLFPGAIALWFAALFGLSSLAVRGALLEEFVLSSRLDMLVPAASPPLGITARLLFALSFAILGGFVGLLTGRLVATRGAVTVAAAPSPHLEPALGKQEAAETSLLPFRLRARDAHPDAPPRRPISAHEELGAENFATPAADEPAEEATLGPAAEEAVIAPVPAPPAPPVLTAAQRIASAPLDDLSHIELIERLAIAMQRRRERDELGQAPHAATAITGAQPASGAQFPESPHSGNGTADWLEHPGTAGKTRDPAPDATEETLRAALASLRSLR